jgi:hypothetical protein
MIRLKRGHDYTLPMKNTPEPADSNVSCGSLFVKSKKDVGWKEMPCDFHVKVTLDVIGHAKRMSSPRGLAPPWRSAISRLGIPKSLIKAKAGPSLSEMVCIFHKAVVCLEAQTAQCFPSHALVIISIKLYLILITKSLDLNSFIIKFIMLRSAQ